MDSVVFSMEGEPRAKGRPRVTTRGRFPVIYTDAKTRQYEKSVAALAKDAMGDAAPLEGPLSVSMRFRMKPPKSMLKWLRKAVMAGEEAYLGANDVDNMLKAVADGLNGVVFIDDKQIVRLYGEKIASEFPGVDVKVIALMPQPDAASLLACCPTAQQTNPSLVVSDTRASAAVSLPRKGGRP